MEPSNRSSYNKNFHKRQYETTKVFTPHHSDKIQPMNIRKEALVPSIQSVSQENEQIIKQITAMNEDMNKMASLGEYLMSENKKLRLHYYNRNQDLNRLLQSIKINTNQNISDISQQIHLLKQANIQTFRAIQANTQLLEEFEKENNHLSSANLQIKDTNIGEQTSHLNPIKARLSNKLNHQYIDKLTQQQTQLLKSEKYLLQQVLSLSQQINKVTKKNLHNKNKSSTQKYSNINNRQQFKINIINCLKSLKELQQEKSAIEHDLSQQQTYNSNVISKMESSAAKLATVTAKFQVKQQELNQLQVSISNKRFILEENHKRCSQLEIQKMKKSDSTKIEELNALNKRISNNKVKNSNKYEEMVGNYYKNINAVKQKIYEHEKNNLIEVESIKSSIDETEIKIEDVKKQYQDVSTTCQEYKNIIEKMGDNSEEIQRLEIMLSTKGRTIFNNILNKI